MQEPKFKFDKFPLLISFKQLVFEGQGEDTEGSWQKNFLAKVMDRRMHQDVNVNVGL